MKIAVKVSGNKYYETHLTIINTFLPNRLTQKEIKVLAFFMGAKKEMTEGDRFNSFLRKKAYKELNLSTAGLSNHLKAMVDKKVLVKSKFSNKYTIKEELFPNREQQDYQFRIINE